MRTPIHTGIIKSIFSANAVPITGKVNLKIGSDSNVANVSKKLHLLNLIYSSGFAL
jgi:hypothetical protein